jgi:nucleotide-binding universal stress UspA family protein
MIRDILLQLSSYPVPTPNWVFGAAAQLADRHEARLSAALCQMHIPKMSNYVADRLVGANQAIAEENRQSRENAEALARAFAEQIPEGVRGDQILIDCLRFMDGSKVAEQARAFDLAVLPVHEDSGHELVAQDLVFGSGRPVLLLPERAQPGWERVVIGWDGGRAAARALAGALPFCRRAAEVRLVTITGEKEVGQGPGLEAMRRHLQQHGVAAELEEVDAGGWGAGIALLRHAEEKRADLLVAGAFGHSRLREFILGGATRSLIEAPGLPVLLSH